MTNEEQAREFNRRRNMASKTDYDHGTRFNVVRLSYNGISLGEKHEVLKRGKVVTTSYHLPSLDTYNTYRALPVAK